MGTEQLVQGMNANTRGYVHVREGYSEEFEVTVRVHQGFFTQPAAFHHCAWSLVR